MLIRRTQLGNVYNADSYNSSWWCE